MRKLQPEHFDILGVVFFPFIFACALYVLLTGNALPHAIIIIILLSWIVGFAIDASIVYHFLLKKTQK